MEFETVRLDGEGPVRHPVLNRPQVHNAVNAQLVSDVYQALLAVEADTSVRVVILRGEGRSLCSGADLKQLLRAPRRTCWAPSRAPACTTRCCTSTR
ncbi:MAG: enoyl-CoA hydratase/isomerase family protein [Acidimicrobiales bacterium]